tara:strand:- start:222 stop:407 length:186 start_codon:yes stop_codon:yes gene_type:complete
MKYSFTAVRGHRKVRDGEFQANNKVDLESEVAWVIRETGADKLTTTDNSGNSKDWRCRVIA